MQLLVQMALVTWFIPPVGGVCPVLGLASCWSNGACTAVLPGPAAYIQTTRPIWPLSPSSAACVAIAAIVFYLVLSVFDCQ